MVRQHATSFAKIYCEGMGLRVVKRVSGFLMSVKVFQFEYGF